MWLYTSLIGLLINMVDIPFDRGANQKGSSLAYKSLRESLDFLLIENEYHIQADKGHIRTILGNGFYKCWQIFNREAFPMVVGGDHTVAISSIFAANEYCRMNRDRLGVLWFDAHADFNTIQTSPSGNLHGTPVAVLCGHTLPMLTFGHTLDTEQFAYYGLRDLDTHEFHRFQEYDMRIIQNENDLKKWCDSFDCIHLSFDVDCLDPTIMSSVNTPVKNGIMLDDLYRILKVIKKSDKLISMDLVEYNPLKGDNSSVIQGIMNQLF